MIDLFMKNKKVVIGTIVAENRVTNKQLI